MVAGSEISLTHPEQEEIEDLMRSELEYDTSKIETTVEDLFKLNQQPGQSQHESKESKSDSGNQKIISNLESIDTQFNRGHNQEIIEDTRNAFRPAAFGEDSLSQKLVAFSTESEDFYEKVSQLNISKDYDDAGTQKSNVSINKVQIIDQTSQQADGSTSHAITDTGEAPKSEQNDEGNDSEMDESVTHSEMLRDLEPYE